MEYLQDLKNVVLPSNAIFQGVIDSNTGKSLSSKLAFLPRLDAESVLCLVTINGVISAPVDVNTQMMNWLSKVKNKLNNKFANMIPEYIKGSGSAVWAQYCSKIEDGYNGLLSQSEKDQLPKPSVIRESISILGELKNVPEPVKILGITKVDGQTLLPVPKTLIEVKESGCTLKFEVGQTFNILIKKVDSTTYLQMDCVPLTPEQVTSFKTVKVPEKVEA